MRFLTAIKAALLSGTFATLAACGPGSVGKPLPPNGVFQEVLVGTSAIVPATSLSSPLQVVNGFSLLISEQYYTDVFTAQIVSFTAPAACYTVTMDSTGHTAIFAPISTSVTTTCPYAGDVESAQIDDVDHHTTIVFFTNIAATMTL
jgi:hypothetical protein